MANWVVTGANRGIGLELCKQLAARGEHVFGACRSASSELDAIGCTVIEGVDVATDAAPAAIERALGASAIDVLVHNAGMLHHDQLESLDFDDMRRHYEVNTIGPLRITKALLPRLGDGSKIGFVSSRAASIGDGPSGGLYGYRASKAALNLIGANLARDLAPRGILVAILHPGFIRTAMTGGRGNDDPPVAATGLIARLDELTAMTSGHFFHANGQELPW